MENERRHRMPNSSSTEFRELSYDLNMSRKTKDQKLAEYHFYAVILFTGVGETTWIFGFETREILMKLQNVCSCTDTKYLLISPTASFRKR